MVDDLERIRALKAQEEAGIPPPGDGPPVPPGAHLPDEMRALLGDYYQPSPFGFRVGKALINDQDVTMLVIEDGYGRRGYPLSANEARILASQLTKAASGLIVPT